MKKIILFYSIYLILNTSFLIHNSLCQYQNIIFNVNNNYNPNEPTIMINPKNTNQIVAGSNIFYINSTDTAISGYYYSTNSGLNWQGGPLLSTIARTAGDPVVIVDTSGNFYFFTITNWGRTDWLDNLICLKSTNGGANWSNGVLFGFNNGRDMDKPWACVDFSHSIYGNNIYVTWTEFDKYHSYSNTDSTHIMFSKSTNGGLSFSQSKRINSQSGNCRDSTNTVEGAVPCTGPNGEIYVAWAGWSNICFNKSTDGGNTWLNVEKTIAQQVGGWRGVTGIVTYNGFPITACDNSNSIYSGNIYVNWVDQRSGATDQDVWIIKSSDGGNNWNVLIRVNTDPPGRNQFFTWMTIDQKTGYIYCVFYDLRNNPTTMTDVYIARSTNGGSNFINVKADTNPFNMINSNLGDYINISAYNNKVRPIWISSTNYINNIYTAIIDTINVGINKISDIVPSSYSLYQNYPNPFNAETKIKFDIQKSVVSSQYSVVTLKIFDITGRYIAILMNEQLHSGTYEVTFDGSNLPSGIYFYQLKADDFVKTKKLLLIK
ncbi:MAG TPA: T9SS type A sorting domain-containing protein [Ignavibacteria bacterium]